MGRKETSCLPNVPCDSMEQQTMKVRPVLLKRKSLDSSGLAKQPNQRRNKSQQVRFKEDSTNAIPPHSAELDMKCCVNTLLVNGKTEKPHSRPMCLLAYPHSQKGLQNMAIQTSPSLRKHFPIFKAKKETATKPIDIMSTESSCEQINGDLSEEVIATEISHLTLSDQFEEGLKWVRRRCPVRHTAPKAQSNGPKSECSGLEFVEMLGRMTVSTQVSDNAIESPLEEIEEPNINLQNDPTPETANDNMIEVSLECSEKCKVTIEKPSDICMDLTNACSDSKQAEITCPVKQSKEFLRLKPNVDCKSIITLTPSCNRNVSYCFHSEHQPIDKLQPLSGSASHLNDSQVSKSFINNERLPTSQIDISGLQKNPARSRSGTESSPCLPKSGMQHGTNNESKSKNPGHKAHGEFGSLQGKLHSIEESLQSNQEKIKILLNVIQDLEKARAFSEGRNSYRTGQDLNNCRTCQSTACIIYRI
ncbi:protein INSYN2B isoform X2 [Mixophyes fleayi]|uniref:protein INSYN2B isoform X2 n=1 Tax=Mixophyes fleayi TaxID=3061075 RepID=UPI003F4D9E83